MCTKCTATTICDDCLEKAFSELEAFITSPVDDSEDIDDAEILADIDYSDDQYRYEHDRYYGDHTSEMSLLGY